MAGKAQTGIPRTAPSRAAAEVYEGWVMHRRLAPRHHRFKYRVFTLLLEPAALPELRLLGANRWGLFSFYDKDHGDGRPLQAWLDGLLAEAGILADGVRRVLCYPRILGYVFNPLSVWFCHDRGGALKAIIYEVHNTYGERNAYVLPVSRDAVPGDDPIVRHACAKGFYVSPFLSPDCRYHFRIAPPGRTVVVAINEEEAGRPILTASFAGERRALTDRALLGMFFRYPLMTLKVVAAIHYEAVRLMLKGVKRHHHIPKAAYSRAAAEEPAPAAARYRLEPAGDAAMTDDHKAKMASRPGTAPGLETDGKGEVIPLAKRTADDRSKAQASAKNPEREAENPAPMPQNQQGQGAAPKPHDPQGQQGAPGR